MPRTKDSETTIQAIVPVEFKERLLEAARADDRTPSSLIRKAVKAELDRRDNLMKRRASA